MTCDIFQVYQELFDEGRTTSTAKRKGSKRKNQPTLGFRDRQRIVTNVLLSFLKVLEEMLLTTEEILQPMRFESVAIAILELAVKYRFREVLNQSHFTLKVL